MSGLKGRSGRRSANEERKLTDLADITYDYLVDNFHKFTEDNKIRIALEIQKRIITSKVEVSGVTTFADAIKQLKWERENIKKYDAEGNLI